MKRARIATLHTIAKQRGDGYLEACLKAGYISHDGQWMIFTNEAHKNLRNQFNPHSSNKSHNIPFVPSPRLGDLMHKIAGPIGKAISWPCLKGDGTTDLKPESPCAKIRNRLNHVKV